MSVEQNPVDNVESNEVKATEAPEINISDLQAQLDQYKAQVEAVDRKNKELLSEKNKWKSAAEAREEQARIEAEEKAKEAGNFKELYESLKENSSKEVEDLRLQLNSLLENNKKEKVMTEAYKMANSLNPASPKAADLLAADIARNLDMVEGELVRKENGQLSSKSLQSLVEQYANDPAWDFARNSNKSSGGSAEGAGTTGTKQRMTLAEFQKAYPSVQAQLKAKDSVELIDN